MRHHSTNKKFGRERNQRIALLKSLAVSLITRGKITTTVAKAKEIRPFVELLVTRARGGSVSARRILVARTGSIRAASKLILDIAPRYKERAGGYTRITKLSPRKSDASPMAVIEFI